jgi:type I restriction enzyme S subunit
MKQYDSYKKSEVSWIEKVPSHWEFLRAKNMFYRVQRPVRDEDETITCFRDGQVTLRKNRRTEGFTEALQESGYQGIRKGDLVIHQMDAFAGAIGVSDSDGKGTPVYICCLPKSEKYVSYYYAHALRQMARTGFIKSLYRGIRERSSDFRYETFAVQKLPIPPVEEQEAIVEFLDSKTLKIDSYVAERERELAALEELRQAEIAHVVTNGLNPDVPMRDSGIPWLGKIPAHWKTESIRSLFRLSSEKTEEPNATLLSLSQYDGIKLKKDAGKTGMFEAETTVGYNVVHKGQFVMNIMLAWNGSYAVSDYDGVISPAYCVFDFIRPCNKKYFDFLLRQQSYASAFKTQSKGLIDSRLRLYPQYFKTFPIIIPPKEEQDAIVDYINAKTAKIDGLIADLSAQIEKLKEYKQRLIADAVTGQIDVRK